MAKILYGKPVMEAMNRRMTAEIADLKARGIAPTLATLRVGDRPDDVAYERGILKRCENLDIEVRKIVLPLETSQEELMATIREINADDAIHGCLIFRKLPGNFDDDAVCAALAPEKDMDGITEGSLAGVFTGKDRGYPPCTAQACMELLDFYSYELKGKKAVVIGRSLVIGKPVAMMLLGRHATVTTCHTRTVDMPSVTRDADVLIAAAGVAGVVDSSYVREDQVVIDVGINFNEDGRMVGDVNYDAVEPIVGAITPVPGGVGTVTTTVLADHVVQAAKKIAAAAHGQ